MSQVFISVDVEVTDTDPVHGRLMQVGLVAEDGSELELVFPVKNTSKTSDWVRENLQELLEDCWRAYSYAFAPVHVRRRGINGIFFAQVQKMHTWVQQRRMAAVSTPEPKPEGGFKLRAADSALAEVQAVMVCYCGGLDWGFVTRAFAHCGLENPFHYEFIEISSLAMGKLGLDYGFPESDLEEALGIDPMVEGTKHNALEDAKHQLDEFQALMRL